MPRLSNMMTHSAKKVEISLATRCPVHTPEAANAVFTMLEDVGLGMERMNTHEPVNIPFTPDAATELWTKGKHSPASMDSTRGVSFSHSMSSPVWDSTYPGRPVPTLTVSASLRSMCIRVSSSSSRRRWYGFLRA